METTIDNILSEIENTNSVDIRVKDGKVFLFWNMFSYCNENRRPIHTCNIAGYGLSVKEKGVLIRAVDYTKKFQHIETLSTSISVPYKKKYEWFSCNSKIVNETDSLILTIKINDLLSVENNAVFSFEHIAIYIDNIFLSKMKNGIYFDYLTETVSLHIGYIKRLLGNYSPNQRETIIVSSILSDVEIFQKIIQAKNKIFELNFDHKTLWKLQ